MPKIYCYQNSQNDSPKSFASVASPFVSKLSQESDERMEGSIGRKVTKRLKRTEHAWGKNWQFITVITQVKDTMSKPSESRNETYPTADWAWEGLTKGNRRARKSKGRARTTTEKRERGKEDRKKQMYEISILIIHIIIMESPLAKYYNSLKTNILKKTAYPCSIFHENYLFFNCEWYFNSWIKIMYWIFHAKIFRVLLCFELVSVLDGYDCCG